MQFTDAMTVAERAGLTATFVANAQIARTGIRVRLMLGFKSIIAANIILSGIELVHMMRKRQAKFAFNPNPSLAEQFDMLAA